MQMSQFVITRRMSFKQPSIGPRHYLAVGASGWAETFCRKEVDAQLLEYVGQVKLSELVDNFRVQLELDNRGQCCWSDVTDYLARIFKVKNEAIPIGVAIGFWAHVVLAGRAKGAN